MAPYVKQTWVDETGVGDGTIFTAARMNHIEDGIKAIDDTLSSVTAGGTVDGGSPSTSHAGNLLIDFGSPT